MEVKNSKINSKFRTLAIRNHFDKIALIMLGHIELFTEEMQQEYLSWCATEEGKQYLKGGSKYKEDFDTKK